LRSPGELIVKEGKDKDEAKTAQPGATDNLGCALRIREGSSFRSSEARCLSFIVGCFFRRWLRRESIDLDFVSPHHESRKPPVKPSPPEIRMVYLSGARILIVALELGNGTKEGVDSHDDGLRLFGRGFLRPRERGEGLSSLTGGLSTLRPESFLATPNQPIQPTRLPVGFG
jgi:hypothetical protein